MKVPVASQQVQQDNDNSYRKPCITTILSAQFVICDFAFNVLEHSFSKARMREFLTENTRGSIGQRRWQRTERARIFAETVAGRYPRIDSYSHASIISYSLSKNICFSTGKSGCKKPLKNRVSAVPDLRGFFDSFFEDLNFGKEGGDMGEGISTELCNEE